MRKLAMLHSPILLESSHSAEHFDCGVPSLNSYIKVHALTNNKNGSARTYVTHREMQIAGYYSLAYGSVSHDAATSRVSKGLAKHPIPIMLLARLAVDNQEKGQGLGKALLKNALLRTLQASEIGGLRAILVHAKDESAKLFYQKYGFEASPIDPFHLFLLMKDLNHVLR